MKITRMLLVVAILVASSFVVSFQNAAEAQSVEAYTCADLNNSSWDGVYGISSAYPTDTWTFEAGDTITLVAEYAGGGSVPPGSTMALWMNSGIASQTSLPGQITYTFSENTMLPPGGHPVLSWEALDDTQSLVDAYWDVSCSSAGAGGQVINGVPVPGCDMRMRLTSDAAVGMFVTDTHVLWGPDANANTGITLPASKTAWVLGMDKTGTFYKFIWSCTYLWAPVSALGPNFDDVWHGTPLPTGVVG